MHRDLVLFVCPHGAAKSILAAALFQRLAEEQNLSFRATCAGNEPDPEIAPHVRALLSREGLELPREQPQAVTAQLLSEATYVISMGCDRDTLPLAPPRWEGWDDVPPPSRDLHGACSRIQERLVTFIAILKDR